MPISPLSLCSGSNSPAKLEMSSTPLSLHKGPQKPAGYSSYLKRNPKLDEAKLNNNNNNKKIKAFPSGSFSFWSFLELSSRLLLFSCTWFFFLIMRVSWSHVLPTVDFFFASCAGQKIRKKKQQTNRFFCPSVLLFFFLYLWAWCSALINQS